MRPSAPPWPSRVSDRALAVAAAAGALLFLVLAAGNPVDPDHLVRLQFAFTPERWNAVLADGATVEVIRSHLVRDVVGMMPAYTVALTALFSLLWRRATAAGRSRASASSLLRSAWLPLAVFAFDLVENAFMWAAATEAGPGPVLVAALSTAAAVKWALVLVTLLGPPISWWRSRRRQG